MDTFHAIIVGAGPAGLTAAIYLARFRRRVLVLGSGASRTSWIPQSHNTPGFPQGVAGLDLLSRLRDQAARYAVDVREAHVHHVLRDGGRFQVVSTAGEHQAATVLVATGVVDNMPSIAGIEAAVRRGLVRICPICDAYEAIDKRIAVLGETPLAEREASFLKTYSDDVSVLTAGTGRLDFEEDAVNWIDAHGVQSTFDCVYLALGCVPQSGVALSAGAKRDRSGDLIVDNRQMTSVEGLYAAGDVVRGLNQIAVATGEAAIAATAIHNRLREAE